VTDELEGARVGLLLTDARGQIVDRRAADSGILARLDRIELAPGFLYSEDLIGTNAIGTAIAQQAPSVVTGGLQLATAAVRQAHRPGDRPPSPGARRPTAAARQRLAELD
jgi:hypothetical protein